MSDNCDRCAKCCNRAPCIMLPGDLPRIAKFLGETEESLFRKYLVLDYYIGKEEYLYYLSPCKQGDTPGTVVPWSWAFDRRPCIFLQGNDCLIHAVKPHEGRTWSCKSTKQGDAVKHKHYYGMRWRRRIPPFLEATGY